MGMAQKDRRMRFRLPPPKPVVEEKPVPTRPVFKLPPRKPVIEEPKTCRSRHCTALAVPPHKHPLGLTGYCKQHDNQPLPEGRTWVMPWDAQNLEPPDEFKLCVMLTDTEGNTLGHLYVDLPPLHRADRDSEDWLGNRAVLLLRGDQPNNSASAIVKMIRQAVRAYYGNTEG